jgi:hypothetical protein
MNRFEAPAHPDEWLEAVWEALTEELGEFPSDEALEARLQELQAEAEAQEELLWDQLAEAF